MTSTCVAAASLASLTSIADAAPQPPAGGHAAVVAHGLVTFDGAASQWLLASSPVSETPTTIAGTSPTFLVADGPAAVLASDPGGPRALLAPGEALFRPAGEPTGLATQTPTAGAISQITVAAGSGPNGFTAEPGTRDVDLVRDVLATNEALIVHSDVSVFVVVTAGSVTADSNVIAAGTGVALTGDITLINTAPQTATVLAAVIGPTIGDAAQPQATPSTTTATEPAPPTSPSAPGNPTPTIAPTTTSTTITTTDPAADSDLDGLTNAQEIGFGTDPENADTDGDGRTDLRELDAFCDPLLPDTDGDGLSDSEEMNYSRCTDPDTDFDGSDDSEERDNGTDPFNADSDGDQLADGRETDNGCNPLDADTDDDTLTDLVEVNDPGFSCSSPDTDGDGTLDADE